MDTAGRPRKEEGNSRRLPLEKEPLFERSSGTGGADLREKRASFRVTRGEAMAQGVLKKSASKKVISPKRQRKEEGCSHPTSLPRGSDGRRCYEPHLLVEKNLGSYHRGSYATGKRADMNSKGPEGHPVGKGLILFLEAATSEGERTMQSLEKKKGDA